MLRGRGAAVDVTRDPLGRENTQATARCYGHDPANVGREIDRVFGGERPVDRAPETSRGAREPNRSGGSPSGPWLDV